MVVGPATVILLTKLFEEKISLIRSFLNPGVQMKRSLLEAISLE